MTEKQKNRAAQELARLRAESLTPERRSEIARIAQRFSVEARHRNKALQTPQDAHNQAETPGEGT